MEPPFWKAQPANETIGKVRQRSRHLYDATFPDESVWKWDYVLEDISRSG